MYELIQEIIKRPFATLLIIGNLILIESLLSVDNAVVLATMVMDLSAKDRKKALRYGIFGAYLFRGLCLVFAAFLIKIWWLKVVGGAYLLYLVWRWGKEKSNNNQEQIKNNTFGSLYKFTIGRVGTFWAAVISVELMDITFSMDNVFAAVAFSNNILIILCGVFIGILAMRFVAQAFVKLIEHYPFLEACAYVVIGLLGIKLSLSLYQHYYPFARLSIFLDSNKADWATSAITISIFLFPVITSILFGFPKRSK
jgi:YkoY family integral membrane protein